MLHQTNVVVYCIYVHNYSSSTEVCEVAFVAVYCKNCCCVDAAHASINSAAVLLPLYVYTQYEIVLLLLQLCCVCSCAPALKKKTVHWGTARRCISLALHYGRNRIGTHESYEMDCFHILYFEVKYSKIY